MRIGADAGVGKFAHVRFGNDDRPAGAQPAHDRRIGGGWFLFFCENPRPCARNFAGDVEKILDAHNRAVHRAERDSGLRARIGGIGRGLRLLTIDGEAGPYPFPLWIIDAGKRGLKPFACGIPCHEDRLC
jgi:hypothetical protein